MRKLTALSDYDYREASGDLPERRPPTPNERHQAELRGEVLCESCGQPMRGGVNFGAFPDLCGDCEQEEATR